MSRHVDHRHNGIAAFGAKFHDIVSTLIPLAWPSTSAFARLIRLAIAIATFGRRLSSAVGQLVLKLDDALAQRGQFLVQSMDRAGHWIR
jgi:hypothetical protein